MPRSRANSISSVSPPEAGFVNAASPNLNGDLNRPRVGSGDSNRAVQHHLGTPNPLQIIQRMSADELEAELFGSEQEEETKHPGLEKLVQILKGYKRHVVMAAMRELYPEEFVNAKAEAKAACQGPGPKLPEEMSSEEEKALNLILPVAEADGRDEMKSKYDQATESEEKMSTKDTTGTSEGPSPCLPGEVPSPRGPPCPLPTEDTTRSNKFGKRVSIQADDNAEDFDPSVHASNRQTSNPGSDDGNDAKQNFGKTKSLAALEDLERKAGYAPTGRLGARVVGSFLMNDEDALQLSQQLRKNGSFHENAPENKDRGASMNSAWSSVVALFKGGGSTASGKQGSVLTKTLEVATYVIALGFIVFVLWAAHSGLGDSHGSSAEDSSAEGSSARLLGDSEGIVSFMNSLTQGLSSSPESFADEHHRRLGGAVSPIMFNITWCLVGAGLLAFIVNLLGLPLILGYLLGGFLVGPYGLSIVISHEEIATMSSLGIVFLLFMIGLELNLEELMKMGKVVIMTGMLQFPICAGVHTGIFTALSAAGISFGKGQYATLYCGLTCGISSTMIVVKLLGDKLEMDTLPGRLTVGILIFQDIWAIILLAIQPNMANPEILGILKTFGMIAVTMFVAWAYAKFVLPAVFFKASKSVELMLVMALSWCFFIGAFSILPFIGLSLELAALISGAVLATFPYRAEFNGKIKYLRDFFVTLFFVAMGMQIPDPSVSGEAIGKACIIVIVVLMVRWLGIFSVVCTAGGGARLGALATLNLSQVSEFALVICSLGVSFEHVEEDTLTILIWAFSILAVATSYFVDLKQKIYSKLHHLTARCRKSQNFTANADDHEDEEHEERDIVILGFYRIASMLVSVFEEKYPQALSKINVIDVNQSIKSKLMQRNVMFSYGDISSPDVLEHAHHGAARLVLCTVPDSKLRGITTAQIVKNAKQVWPEAIVLAIAENQKQLKQLYADGADYVLHQPRLCAERIEELLEDYITQAFHDGELKQLLANQSEMQRIHASVCSELS